MAMIRCLQYTTPLTDEEIGTGACPMCAAPVAPPVPVAEAAPPLPQVTGPTLLSTVLFLVSGALVFCLVPFGFIMYASLPEERPEPTQAEKKEPLAEVKPKAGPTPAKQ